MTILRSVQSSLQPADTIALCTAVPVKSSSQFYTLHTVSYCQFTILPIVQSQLRPVYISIHYTEPVKSTHNSTHCTKPIKSICVSTHNTEPVKSSLPLPTVFLCIQGVPSSYLCLCILTGLTHAAAADIHTAQCSDRSVGRSPHYPHNNVTFQCPCSSANCLLPSRFCSREVCINITPCLCVLHVGSQSVQARGPLCYASDLY